MTAVDWAYYSGMSEKRVLITGGSGFIGVHLVSALIEQGYSVLNVDVRAPVDGINSDLWCDCSILNYELFRDIISSYSPNFIVHLAATTTQNATNLEEFEVNIKGTKNILEVANSLGNLKKLVFTSTQYVNSPGHPYSEYLEELCPYGYYGESKLLGEKMTRDLLHNLSWIIIRPTTIWGPWHPILTDGLWKQILNGRYFHPKGDEAIKTYGYVKNTAWQIVRLLEMEISCTDKKVFYIGDENIRQDRWVSAFVTRLTNQRMRNVPKTILFILSEIGELLSKFGIKFPLYRSRYRNLVTSNPSPLQKTLTLLGPSPISFEVAVDETCTWLEQNYDKSRRVD